MTSAAGRLRRDRPLAWRVEAAGEDLVWFGVKQAVACAFPVGFFLILGLSRIVSVPGLARYDLVLGAAVALQLALVAVGFETWRDARVALRFHGLGLALVSSTGRASPSRSGHRRPDEPNSSGS